MTDRKGFDPAAGTFESGPDWLDDVVIRILKKADLPKLEWEGQFTRYRRIYADVFQRSRRGLAVPWVAELKEVGLVGQVFIQLRTNDTAMADGFRRAYLHSFRVRPAFRGAGLGTLMMSVVEEDLSRRGFSEITLNVAKDNPRARSLYERLGFQVIHDDPGQWTYYDEKGVLRYVSEPGWRMLKA
ncbi:MAG: GNAT family N-acetyltransferase [Anaerolineae bacterium]|nr:GNAT family N-acetyltransferase [Anaerolineae bacterium]